mmetsp:Transcript_1062/g.6767  ORF Transcript_1062/g.6767 Transcript_1062/m.6767 type:complete len:129 (-) Transcript_1062:920-1306(-)
MQSPTSYYSTANNGNRRDEGRETSTQAESHACHSPCLRKESITNHRDEGLHFARFCVLRAFSTARKTKSCNSSTVTDMESSLRNGCTSIYILVQYIRSTPMKVIHRISEPLPPHWYVGNAPDSLHSPT